MLALAQTYTANTAPLRLLTVLIGLFNNRVVKS